MEIAYYLLTLNGTLALFTMLINEYELAEFHTILVLLFLVGILTAEGLIKPENKD